MRAIVILADAIVILAGVFFIWVKLLEIEPKLESFWARGRRMRSIGLHMAARGRSQSSCDGKAVNEQTVLRLIGDGPAGVETGTSEG